MPINWTGGSSAYWVVIGGTGGTTAADNPTQGASTSFSCYVPSSAGSFTIPASILLTLPGGTDAEIDFHPTLPPQALSASGLDVGSLQFQYETTFFVPLK